MAHKSSTILPLLNLPRRTALIACMWFAWSAVSLAQASAPSTPQDRMQRSMTFEIDSDQARIQFTGVPSVYATGVIDSQTPALFESLQRSGLIENGAHIYLNSLGGDLSAGMELGRLFRAAGIATSVGVKPELDDTGKPMNQSPAFCVSSCAYAYFGGEYRYSPVAPNMFGIHQFYYEKNSVADVGEVEQASGVVVNYLRDMGINPGVFAAAATKGRSEALWLTGDEMLKYGLANDGRKPVSEEVKLVMGHPYLVIDQMTYDGEHKLTLMCDDGNVETDAYYIVGASKAAQIVQSAVRSYFEINGIPAYIAGSDGAKVLNNAVIIARTMGIGPLLQITESPFFGAWISDGAHPGYREGFSILLGTVRDQLRNYAKNCMQAVIYQKK
uniref:Uncharacterized protein n=1 Tax=Mycena chlorophos TaxID=658473 RepID=A0ABQ0L551_MYCCL|nr:predicted protein [Mycena chlorophos]